MRSGEWRGGSRRWWGVKKIHAATLCAHAGTHTPHTRKDAFLCVRVGYTGIQVISILGGEFEFFRSQLEFFLKIGSQKRNLVIFKRLFLKNMTLISQ